MTNSNTTKTRISRKTRLLGLLAVAVSAVALVPAGASASTVNATTNLDMDTQGTQVPGFEDLIVTIDSAQPTCERKRHVTLSRHVQGHIDSQELASETVSHKLVHSISYSDDSPYTVVVDRKVLRKGGGQKIVCKPAQLTEFPNG
ncbi:hypothetical protein BH10ACT11_BH10ACT11_09670 [soil metagenome]